MRHARFVFLAASIAATALPSCTDSRPAGVYAYIEWRVRCDMGDGPEDNCTAYPDRFVDGFDGEGARISCNVTENDDSRTLNFSVSGSDFGLQLQNATFPRGGATPSPAGCRVTVRDDNAYTGTCGGNPPSASQECQVSGVSFGRDDEGRALISGQIFCVGISPEASLNIDRELTAPGPTARTTPLTFNIYDCPGYQPD
ncbi:hypothetical protein [Sandaracinus amylolyticus]|uniref:Lipoprotein n=1 Tax=Sandaracinus amylolyticus TaxID=927083 RepID=A0A0F6VZR5_9BACT|nr:hypothetical protein [Sandaracinus amylolyticus]AKF03780.1 hypothetical protein DB32_000929 [Sandaracinus amylolyticus]